MRSVLPVAGLCALGLAVVSCAPASGPENAAGPESIIEFRSASESPRPNWTQDTLAGDLIYVAPDAVISDSDIEHVDVVVRGSQLVLDVWLAPEGARRLHATTAESLGGRLALVLNSELMKAPVIRSPIPGGERRIQVGVSVPDSVTEHTVAQLRSRWPPR